MTVSDPRLPDNPIVWANQAFLDLTGYSADEVLGRNGRFMQGPETDPAHVQLLAKCLAYNGHVTTDILNYRKDGTSFWNRLSISPVLAEDGDVLYYLGSQMDMTAQRRAQDLAQVEKALLREVDHRALNALMIVDSFMRQSDASNPEQYALAVQGRVGALARAHHLLARGGWSPMPLTAVIDAELALLPQDRIKVSGDATPLPAEIVQAVSLVVHELASNAARHGALSFPGGMLEITCFATDDGECAHLSWLETGVAFKRAVQPSFGLRMVASIIERQLGGVLKLTWTPSGLHASVVIPVKSCF
ncbi:PAS domain-containing protein [Brevundimonas sp. PAMC22021]|uniref:PAS domain-containing protein n=1 Tax=Brevundimonas sp. PAMC22021 TaxID=2861285 RepID=UPI001C62651A|nr:PAS domain-containing protein [Brevundimonas sp. PAMC22021]QYF87023.1 PAS domain-containing protein [Brevundimonas sp. PAMC22021]